MIQFEQQHHGMDFNVPWGGLGFFLEHRALEQLLTPIFCPDPPLHESSPSVTYSGALSSHLARLREASGGLNLESGFMDNACQQLQKDEFGESKLFQQGVTLLELMDKYAFFQPFQDYQEWTHGSCFHSDFIWSIFFERYLLVDAKPTGISAYGGSSTINEYDLLQPSQ